VIPYHGTPITPDTCALEALSRGHGFVAYATPQQIRLVAEVCRSFAIDNGAFIFWQNDREPDWPAFYTWLAHWIFHPRLDFVVIPDKIEGTEAENDALIEAWPYGKEKGAPVWHTNESPERLQRLAREFPRVCIGSSGEYDVKWKDKYLARVKEVLHPICNSQGFPTTKIHLLRGLNPAIFTKLPASSADSTNVGRNIGIDSRWKGTYQPKSKTVRTRILVDRIEHFNSACRLEMEYDL
jgi:hypothetical protein